MKKKKTEEKLKKTKKQKDIKLPEKISAPETNTLSIALPGSILDNAQSPELRTYLAGQIARAACIYKVDEVNTVSIFSYFKDIDSYNSFHFLDYRIQRFRRIRECLHRCNRV